ncbi:MAG: FtsX-like permease family protein, partial [Clostridia bacterium]|nr:FtsX-like permease family protein [Clostridia bacterium]
YLGEDVSASEAIDQVVTMGIKYHTDLTFKFLMPVDDNVVLAVSTYMNNIGFEVNDSKYSGNELVVSIDYFTFSNEFVIDRLVNGAQYTNPETGEKTTIVPPYKAALVAENPVIVNNIYDTTNSKEYKIVGVLKEDNTSMFSTMSTGNESEGFSIFEVLMNSVKGSCYMLIDETNLKPLGEEETDLNKVPMSFAYLRFKNEDVMDDRVNDVTAAFMSQQMLMYGKDFMIISMSAVASVIDSVMNTLTIMLTVISIVSLIIGGIGIMNIMLVAVTERTREIGIRKAIGAKRGSILTQFLVEALMLSLLGGAIGLTISGIGCAIIGHFIGFRIVMPLWVIGMSVGFCSFIGLAFGMFPAIKASHMQPIDALRRD